MRKWSDSQNLHTETSIVEVARKEMGTLRDLAAKAYAGGQKLYAAELLGKALEIAKSINDTYEIVYFSTWQGMSLIEAGKYRQALAILAPFLQTQQAPGQAEDFYNLLKTYIGIAQHLPVNLKVIEKAFAQTNNFLRNTGNLSWRHGSLWLQANLYRHRGRHHQALQTYQESWTLWRAEYPAYIADEHLSSLVYAALTLHNTPLARQYIAEWEHQKDDTPVHRAIIFACAYSHLARVENHSDEAINWARQAILTAEQIDHEEEKKTALVTTVRSLLFADQSELTRGFLCSLLCLRHVENGHNRYEVRLLWGDYYLACARLAAGMRSADDEYGLDFPPPVQIADAPTTLRAIERAKRGYAAARKVGQWIDLQLECTKRQDELRQRLARVEAIEAKLYQP